MTRSKIFVCFLSLLMGVSFLFPFDASASSVYDNSFINEFPLKATILDDKSTTYKEFRNHLKTVEFSITNFNDYVISTSVNKTALDKYKNLKFDSSHRWLYMSMSTNYNAALQNNDNRDVYMYYTEDSDLKITTHNDSWFFTNNTNRDIKVSLYRWSAFAWSNLNFFPENKSGFGTFSSFDFTVSANQKYYLMTKKDSSDYYRFMLNNFDVEYPSNYEGPKFNKELPKLISKFFPIVSGQIEGQSLSAIVKKDNMYFNFDYLTNQNYRYRLFYYDSSKNENILIDEKTLSFFDTYRYEFSNDSLHGLYKVYVLPVLKPPYSSEFNFQEVGIPLEYKGFSTSTYFSSDEVSVGSVKPVFSLESCDVLDVSCHIRNLGVIINKAFYGFIESLKSFFIPSSASVNKLFINFNRSVSESLTSVVGFLKSILLIGESFIQSIFPLIYESSYSPPCKIIPNFQFFGSSVNIDICIIERSVGIDTFNILRNLISAILIFLLIGHSYVLIGRIGDLLAS